MPERQFFLTFIASLPLSSGARGLVKGFKYLDSIQRLKIDTCTQVPDKLFTKGPLREEEQKVKRVKKSLLRLDVQQNRDNNQSEAFAGHVSRILTICFAVSSFCFLLPSSCFDEDQILFSDTQL
jgi:hypothetical protein